MGTRILKVKILLGLLALSLPYWAYAQEAFSIRGIIYSGAEPVAGATIYIRETRQGTISIADGSFLIDNVKEGTYTVYISFVGYQGIVKRVHVPLPEDLAIVLQESVNSLDEVVVIGDVFRQTQRESSVVIEKITAQEIARNSGTTLMNSLERLPGISSINMGVGVSKPVIRGMSFNRVVVNDSGIKQEGQQWGSDHGLEIDQFNVENIEIIRGPASLAYGSDALGGVLNISHPVMKLTGEHEADVNLFFRSNNNTIGTSASGVGNHKGFVYKVRLTGLEYADYKVPAKEFHYNRFVLPIYDKALKNTAGKERHGSALVGVQKNWGFTHITVSNFNQQVGIFSGAMGIPRAYQLTPDGNDRNVDLPSQDVNHLKIISNSSIKLGEKWIEIDAGYQKNVRKEYSNPHAHGSGEVQHGTLALQLDLHTVTANARLYAGKDNYQYIIGFQSSMQQNYAKGYEFLIPDFNTYQMGAFILHKHNIHDHLIINGGLRADIGGIQADKVSYPFYHENNFIDSVQRSPDVDRDFFNYSAGAGASYQLDDKNNLKINFGKTFRVPVPSELTANGMHHGTFRYEVGDEAIEPEEGFQFDAVWNYKAIEVDITVSPFYNYFQNYIYLSPSGVFPTVEIDEEIYPIAEAGQMYRFKQTSAIHTGGEFQANWKPWRNLALSLNGEYVWAQNQATQLPLPFTPPGSLQATADLMFPHTPVIKNPFINVNAGYYFSQRRVERNEPATDSYYLINIATGFGIGKSKEWLSAGFNVQNVLNKRYMNHLSRYRILNLPEPARSFTMNLRFRLGNYR